MVDCHNHLQDPRLERDLDAIVRTLRREGVDVWIVNGTSEADWARVASLADRYEEVIPFFGLHPWFSGERSADWLVTLKSYLDRYPRAGIGEIGLDKWIRNADLEDQDRVFRAQLDLAIERDRSLAVHCLQAWGTMLERVEEYGIGSRMLMHSFGGPVEMLPSLEEAGVYFSISGYFFREGKEDKRETFARVSPERLLVESDAPDMALPKERCRYFLGRGKAGDDMNHPANLPVVYELVSRLCDTGVSDLQDQVKRNMRAWLNQESP